jgi:hypothetical protein
LVVQFASVLAITQNAPSGHSVALLGRQITVWPFNSIVMAPSGTTTLSCAIAALGTKGGTT